MLGAYGAIRLDGRLADRALEYVLRSRRDLYSSERRAVSESVYGLLRCERSLDFLLGRTEPRFDQRPSSEQALLRFAAWRTRNGETPSQVADALRLGAADREAMGRQARFEGELAALEGASGLAVRASLPDWLAEKLLAQYGAQASALADAMNARGPLVVRTNALKTERAALIDRLNQEGVSARPTLRSPLGAVLETRENVFSMEPFREGWMEIQDEGSQLLGCIVDAPPTRVIDACAGAGGKTLQLAAQMRNRGELFALDIDARRLDDLRLRARRDGVHNVRVHVLPSADASPAEQLPQLVGRIDRVLVDAPCSGSGTLRRNPDARYRLTEPSVQEHAARQFALLKRFAPLLKVGGRLIYGTCSVLFEENEAIVEKFLSSHPEFRLRSASEWLPEAAHDAVDQGYLRALPHLHNTDGFFGAVLEKHTPEKDE
ncbi:MAG: RsmB/NOP family class I SAM-dependent RNA methyltransferase [Myxococcaceae bacterium]